MKLNKDARKMLYQCAVTIKGDHPDWSNFSCLEQAFIKCAGMSNYDAPLETMLPEYAANPKAEISSFIKRKTS